MANTLTRFLFDNRSIRGEIVQLQESFQAVLDSYHYPPAIASLLGELMAAASLLTATLKFKGELALQVQSEGILKYAVINGTHEQKLRGVARWDESVKDIPTEFSKLFQKGALAITLAPADGERYQGIVALDKDNLAACLEDYFLQSEQLLTKVYLATDLQKDARAAGLLLQIVPQTSETVQSSDNPDFEHLSVLADTVKEDELLKLAPQTLIHRLFHEEDIRLFEAQTVTFECDCSKARSANALRNISKSELLQIINEDGSIKMNCQFCHSEYRFDQVDVENIHADNFKVFEDTVGKVKH
ncbi:Hsp33 family molecular chaperone HslO [Ningiella sp. W23]|uniref:Hsp33 family molecular chaperone HslO n=1 Tax=Ningiella sp. W23 TaxID=3023715 RepID=UPI003756B288